MFFLEVVNSFYKKVLKKIKFYIFRLYYYIIFLGDSMDLKDQFRYLVGGYFGVTYMDEYPLKEFVLKDIENYIRDFIEINPIDDFDYVLESEKVKDEVSVLVKLQDSLLVLNKINADMDLVLLVKRKIKSMK